MFRKGLDLNPVRGRGQAGLRPVLVISHDIFNKSSGTVTALAITSQPQKAGYHLSYPMKTIRLPKPSWVKISQIRTLSTERLAKKIGLISPEELTDIVDGLFELVH